MTHSARRVNTLSKRLSAQTYLEIGVCEGDTFRLIEVADRTGVDPNFRFDTQPIVDKSTRLIESTSDIFFSSLPTQKKYDIVFIDGLHTFEQVVRDISNCILHTHDRSVIILDDTLPSDVYSSLPDISQTSKFRTMVGSPSRDWHGDVFKAVFYIHDFWPSLNYRTIITGGNPQTLVWRSASTQQQPAFNSLEAISRLTYFDLHNHMEILRNMREEEAIEECFSGICA